MRIFIYGFAHSGTTILRKLIGDHSKLYDYPYEVVEPPEMDNCVFKSTGLPTWRFRDCYRIMIIKNPYDIFGSFYLRFGESFLDIPGHRIRDYEDHVMHFLETDDYKIKYENLELDVMVDIFDNLGLEYEWPKIRDADAGAKCATPTDKPESQKEGPDHGLYRQWQINQPFRNMTGESAKYLPENVRKVLEQNKVINLLYDR